MTVSAMRARDPVFSTEMIANADGAGLLADVQVEKPRPDPFAIQLPGHGFEPADEDHALIQA